MATGVDTSQLRQLSRDFASVNPDKQVKKALKVAGDIIADDAKRRVAGFSKTTPGTIRRYVRGKTVTVQAGGPGHPIAGLLELGNASGFKSHHARERGFFRHPVHGHMDRWVLQPRRAYLLPAAEANQQKVNELCARALGDTMHEARLLL